MMVIGKGAYHIIGKRKINIAGDAYPVQFHNRCLGVPI